MSIENTDTFGNYLIHGIDEVFLPGDVSWFPSAPGWKVLTSILLLWLMIKVIKWVKQWWHNRYRREALRQLGQVQKDAGSKLQNIVAVLPYYLKVTALQAYSRQDVASLTGYEWLVFLDAHYTGPPFSEGVGKKLLSVAYLPDEKWQLNNEESNALIKMSRLWIATHKEKYRV